MTVDLGFGLITCQRYLDVPGQAAAAGGIGGFPVPRLQCRLCPALAPPGT